MIEDFNPVDTLLAEIKGNTHFLEAILFPKIRVVLVIILFGALVAIKLITG
jgi:hypothetical protein